MSRSPQIVRMAWGGIALTALLLVLTMVQLRTLEARHRQTRATLETAQLQHVQNQADLIGTQLSATTLLLQGLANGLAGAPPGSPLAAAQLQAAYGKAPQALRALFTIDRQGNVRNIIPAAALSTLGLPVHLLRPERRALELGRNCQLINGASATYAELFVVTGLSADGMETLHGLIDLSALVPASIAPSPADGEFFGLLDEQGRILHGPSPRLRQRVLTELLQPDDGNHLTLRQALARGHNRLETVVFGHDDPASPGLPSEPALLSLAPIHLNGQTWSLAYTLPESRIAAAGDARLAMAAPLILAWAASALLFALLFQKQRQVQALQAEREDELAARQQLQHEFENLRERCDQLLNSNNDPVFLIDPESGQLLEVNRLAEAALGYSCGELRQLSLLALFPGRQRQRFLRLIGQVRRNGYAEAPELQFRRKDGSLFVGAVQARSGRLGRQPIIFGSFRDVTPGIRLTMELRRHNRQLRLLNEIAHRVAEDHDLPTMLSTILTQVIDSLNVAGGGIYLLQHQSTEMQLVIHRDIPQAVLQELNALRPGQGLVGKVVETGRPRLSTDLQRDYRRFSAAVAVDGWRAFLAAPLIAGERPVGALFVFDRGGRLLNRDDVRLLQAIGRQVGPLVRNAELFDELQWQHRLNQATLRELERSRQALDEHIRQLEQNHRALQSLEQMKSSFLALASHELRTPLTHIRSGSEFLLESGAVDGGNARQALAAIRNGGQRLESIVSDLLEAARLESRSLYLAREPFDPQHLLASLLEEHSVVCRERDLDCSLGEFPSSLSLVGDVYHLRRALGRIIENAIKFTPSQGWIRVDGAVRQPTEVNARRDRLERFAPGFFAAGLAAPYLEIAITDSGIGLDPDDQLRIFDKFVELGDISGHSTSTARFGGKGVGLGLTLVKGVIEAHDGMLWVESAGQEQGSRFAMLLPLTAAVGAAHANG